MERRFLRGGAFLILSLAACGGDPLHVRRGAGADLVDNGIGLGGRNRDICVRVGDGDCASVFRVHALRRSADLSAQWLSDREVEVFVIGGSVRRCRPSIEGITVRLHRWDSDPGAAPDVSDHGADSLFRKLPDSCADFA